MTAPRSDFPTFRAYRRAVVADMVANTAGPPLSVRRQHFGAWAFANRAVLYRAWLRGFTPRQSGLALYHEAHLQAPDIFTDETAILH